MTSVDKCEQLRNGQETTLNKYFFNRWLIERHVVSPFFALKDAWFSGDDGCKAKGTSSSINFSLLYSSQMRKVCGLDLLILKEFCLAKKRKFTEWFAWEGDLEDHPFQTPLPWAGTSSIRLSCSEVHAAGLEYLQEVASTTFLDKLFQCLTHCSKVK